MGGRRAAKAVGPDYDSFTVEGMVRHKRSVAAKNESQKGTGEVSFHPIKATCKCGINIPFRQSFTGVCLNILEQACPNKVQLW